MPNATKAEHDRQYRELAEAIQSEINKFARRLSAEGKAPMLNAVASALVIVTGNMLAAIEDRSIRKALRRDMDREIPKVIAHFEVRKEFATTIIEGRRHDA